MPAGDLGKEIQKNTGLSPRKDGNLRRVQGRNELLEEGLQNVGHTSGTSWSLCWKLSQETGAVCVVGLIFAGADCWACQCMRAKAALMMA